MNGRDEDHGLWEAVNRLVDSMTVESMRVHGVLPLGARRLRARGAAVPPDFAHEERATRAATMIVPTLLRHARDAYDGQLLVFKGPEVSSRFPHGARSFNDLDFLVPDARSAQNALLAAGFLEVPDPTDHYRDIHHLAPLVWPELPLKIEIHERPKWPHGLPPPPLDEVFEAAVPSSSGVPDVQAPAPHHHALILAVHGWSHAPLRNVRDLVDVAAVAADASDADLARSARLWNMSKMWETTCDAIRWRLFGEPRPAAVSLFARHLIDLREPTVLEGHVQRWISPFWLVPPGTAIGLVLRAAVKDLTPREGESWGEKARRFGRAVRHASMPKSDHGWVNEDAPPAVELPRRPLD